MLPHHTLRLATVVNRSAAVNPFVARHAAPVMMMALILTAVIAEQDGDEISAFIIAELYNVMVYRKSFVHNHVCVLHGSQCTAATTDTIQKLLSSAVPLMRLPRTVPGLVCASLYDLVSNAAMSIDDPCPTKNQASHRLRANALYTLDRFDRAGSSVGSFLAGDPRFLHVCDAAKAVLKGADAKIRQGLPPGILLNNSTILNHPPVYVASSGQMHVVSTAITQPQQEELLSFTNASFCDQWPSDLVNNVLTVFQSAANGSSDFVARKRIVHAIQPTVGVPPEAAVADDFVSSSSSSSPSSFSFSSSSTAASAAEGKPGPVQAQGPVVRSRPRKKVAALSSSKAKAAKKDDTPTDLR